MKPKTFKIFVALSMGITLTAAILSLIGGAITGFYPAMIVLWMIALVPIGSELYSKKMNTGSGNFTALAVINLLCILVVLWMSFVITIDRIIPNFN